MGVLVALKTTPTEALEVVLITHIDLHLEELASESALRLTYLLNFRTGIRFRS